MYVLAPMLANLTEPDPQTQGEGLAPQDYVLAAVVLNSG